MLIPGPGGRCGDGPARGPGPRPGRACAVPVPLGRPAAGRPRARDWTRHEVTAQVPADAISIIFGVYLNGRGQIELRNPRSSATLKATRARRGKLGPVKVVFDAELWPWDARRTDTWIFVSLPVSQSEEIRDLTGGLRRGFGSIRVRVTIGSTTWMTSIFPDSQAGYVLPVKRPVRVAEALDVGDVATVTVELIDFT